MFTNLYASLQEWNNRTSERQKLQQTYLSAAAIIIVLAGLVSLLAPATGQLLARLALLAVVVYFVNGVVWHLVHSALVLKLTAQAKTARATAKTSR